MDDNGFPISASTVRFKYARVFECVVELFNLREGEKTSTQFEIVVKVTDKLYESGQLSDYLYENLKEAFNLYPTLLPGKVAAGYKENQLAEENRLRKINQLLDLLIKDLNEEIKDVAESIAERQACEIDDEDK